MASLSSLKLALRQKLTATASSPAQTLSDTQYSAGYEIITKGLGAATYHDFIIPQISQLLTRLLDSRTDVSVLEIGPGPKSVLGDLPEHLRRGIKKYVAFEPKGIFATRLGEWLSTTTKTECPLPCLDNKPDIHSLPFILDSNSEINIDTDVIKSKGKFDVILFCHSLYGMKPRADFVRQALEMLAKEPGSGMVVVFHRDTDALGFDGLICQRTASFPQGIVSVPDDDAVLDTFAAFIAGCDVQDSEADKTVRSEWRKLCRDMGRYDNEKGHLWFNAPNTMLAFTHAATTLPELASQVLLTQDEVHIIRNREARLRRSAIIVRPANYQQVQQCVKWALKLGLGLTVIGGGHSGHCLQPNVVAVDMCAFRKVHVVAVTIRKNGSMCRIRKTLVTAEAGCTTRDIVRKCQQAGVTVPLGARPSVGAGLWLNGGIGHLARLYGLSCDAIIGALLVSVDSGELFCVGHVPSEQCPADAVRPENESELLWAIKGAGTNFGIVISVTFRSECFRKFTVRECVVPLGNSLEAQRILSDFDHVTSKMSSGDRERSLDAYLYFEDGQLQLGMTCFESSAHTVLPYDPPNPLGIAAREMFGPESNFKFLADRVLTTDELFEADMYMTRMHGGHGSGKTTSFKRCVFLKRIGDAEVAEILVTAVKTRPTPQCYLHLLQGGGAIRDIPPDNTAFGCRDWDFACVITGVWPRDRDGSETAREVVKWVYNIATKLLPYCRGVYGADLGPDPRDIPLAAKAFGPNGPRLARLKQVCDPQNVLAYTCPIVETPTKTSLFILVTGYHGAGKDYCAKIWVSMFDVYPHRRLTARAVSISDTTKRDYATATGADLNRLLTDRNYKEQHRSALTEFFQDQVRRQPRLPEEQFMRVVNGAQDVDVLFITGMRDRAPVASLSHLVSHARLIEVCIHASEEARQARRGLLGGDTSGNQGKDSSRVLNHRPQFIFENDASGEEAVRQFADHHLLPFFHEDLQRLTNMVRRIPNFPRASIEFRHILDIAQRPGGLALCASLLQAHFTGDWSNIHAIACCEAGGFVYASALAAQVDIPLALIREAGKLPPPTVSILKSTSHISASAAKRIEMDSGLIPPGASVVVVDDVLATGNTLCAVLQLLEQAGVNKEQISVMVVAEFPLHRGRGLLRSRGFGMVSIQSLLVFDGA